MLETEKKQLLPYIIIATLFFATTLMIVFTVNPFETAIWVLITFYLSLAFFLIGFFGFFLYLLRIKSVQLLPYEKHRIAFRESALLSALITGSLFLSSRHLLYWWIEAVFIITIILIETFFLI